MYKKIILLVLAFLFYCHIPTPVAANSLDPANMQANLCIGGISLGSSLSYVKQIYGTPTKISHFTENGSEVISYDYNNLFLVTTYVTPTGNTWVNYVQCKESNLSTPNGIKVGMSLKKAQQLFKNMLQPVSIYEASVLPPGYSYYYYCDGAFEFRLSIDEGIIHSIELIYTE